MSEIITAVLLCMGCVFCLIAAVGILRLPDTLIRMHAATKAGTLGAGLILAAVAVCFSEVGTVLKALLTLVFLYLTAPVAAHLIGRAAYRSGIRFFSRTWVDHLGEDINASQTSPHGIAAANIQGTPARNNVSDEPQRKGPTKQPTNTKDKRE